MSFLTKLFGKPNKEVKEISTGSGNKKPKSKPELTGTTMRPPAESTRITEKKPTPEITALELADKQDWQVKTLPVWKPGDVILDTYEVEDVISGGMGYVYIANHKNWKVKLAIKSPNEMMLSDKDFFARILREANSWTELGLHPNIAYCYYVRNIEEVPHIVVEYVDGGDLKTWIEEGKCIDYRMNIDLAIQFCHGMEYAHSKGMIHRDIKPANVLMTKDGVLKITDFGLVRRDGAGAESPRPKEGGTIQSQAAGLTTMGTLMGTEGYMAPEQAESAHDADQRADIFSFGICLYEMFCGNRPYDITYGPRQEPPNPVSLSGDTNLPLDVAAVLTKAVQWDPSERYNSFDEIRQAFCRIRRNLFGEDSPYAELELIDQEADGLNNQGVAYFELGRKEDAKSLFRQVIQKDPTHPEATYNLSLVEWHGGKIADDEAVKRMENCLKNPELDERGRSLLANIHVERFHPRIAKEVLQEKPGLFESLFGENDLPEIQDWVIFEEHPGVHSVGISPDGLYAASAEGRNFLRIWDLKHRKSIVDLQGHTECINSVAFSPDGQYMVSGSGHNFGNECSLRLWDVDKRECVAVLEGHTGPVKSVCFSPDGQQILSAGGSGIDSADYTLRLWDLKRRQCVTVLDGHTKGVNSVVFSPDGNYALSGGVDKTVRLWDIKRQKCIVDLQGHTDMVKSVAFSPDGQYVLSGSFDKTVRLWSVKCHRCVTTLIGHKSIVKSVSFSKDGNYALSGSKDATLRLWNLQERRCIATLMGHTGSVNSVKFFPDGLHVLSGSSDGTVRVWDVSRIYTKHQYRSNLRLYHPRGYKDLSKEKTELTAIMDTIDVLMESKEYQQSFSILMKEWHKKSFAEDKRFVKRFRALHAKGKTKALIMAHEFYSLQGHTGTVYSVAFSPDGRYALSGSGDKTVRLWELESRRCVATFKGHNGEVKCVSFAPNGLVAVSAGGGKDHPLRIWNLKERKCIAALIGHDERVESVTFSPDSRYVLSGSADKTLRLWSLETCQCVAILEGHTKAVTSVSISADGQVAISGGFDKSLLIWDLKRCKCIGDLEGNRTFGPIITSNCISKDSSFALSGEALMFDDSNERGFVSLWDLDNKRRLARLKGHTGRVKCVILTPDGLMGLSGGEDKKLRVWDLKARRCIATIEGAGALREVLSMSISPDGRLLLAGGYARGIKAWRLVWDLEF